MIAPLLVIWLNIPSPAEVLFFPIIRFNQSAVHYKNIEHISVISAFYYSAVVEDQLKTSVFLGKMEFHIIVVAIGFRIYLRPYAGFHCFLLVRPYQIPETMTGVGKEIIKIAATCKFDKLLVCEQDTVIFRVCHVYQKCSREILGYILKRESKAASVPYLVLVFLAIGNAAMLSVKLYFIERHVRTAYKFRYIIAILW